MAVTGQYGAIGYEGWQIIQAEFNEAIGGERMCRIAELSGEIAQQDMLIEVTQSLIDFITKCGPKQEWCDQLRGMGFEADYTEESYRTDLERVALRAKAFIMNREVKKAELKDLLPTDVPDTVPTKARYVTALVRMSQHFKFQLDYHKLTTLEFCTYYKDYHAYVERQNAAPKNVAE